LANTYLPQILLPVLIENDQLMKRQKVGHQMENQPSTRTVSAAPERVIPSDVLPYASSHNACCIKIEAKQGETVQKLTKRKSDDCVTWTIPSKYVKQTTVNKVDDRIVTSSNTYEILSNDEEDLDHIDVETVKSEVSNIEELEQDEPVRTMHDLFRPGEEVLIHVSDDERSSVDITDDDDKVDSIKLAPRENMCDVLQDSDVSIDASHGSK